MFYNGPAVSVPPGCTRSSTSGSRGGSTISPPSRSARAATTSTSWPHATRPSWCRRSTAAAAAGTGIACTPSRSSTRSGRVVVAVLGVQPRTRADRGGWHHGNAGELEPPARRSGRGKRPSWRQLFDVGEWDRRARGLAGGPVGPSHEPALLRSERTLAFGPVSGAALLARGRAAGAATPIGSDAVVSISLSPELVNLANAPHLHGSPLC